MAETQVYAHVEAGRVLEVIHIEPGTPSLAERYYAAIVENCILLVGNQIRNVKPGMLYDGNGFYTPALPQPVVVPQYVTVATIRERLEAIGKWSDLIALLQQDMPTMVKVLTLRDGVLPDDPLAQSMLKAIGLDPDTILRPGE